MRNFIAILLLMAPAFCLSADEYLYPVGSFENVAGKKKIYLIYQRSSEYLELLVWDPVTQETVKALLSTFTPAGFQMLPDQSGFSFVDNGRVRVKFFSKRSPKVVSFFHPVSDINTITWLDSKNFYFMAKAGKQYGIFQANTQGDIVPLINDEIADYLYPQKRDNKLFFIERTQDGQHALKTIDYTQITYKEWPLNPDKETYAKQVEELLAHDHESLINVPQTTMVIDFEGRRVAFLNMVSSTEGFIIEHPGNIERTALLIEFHYHHITKSGEAWEREELFSFSLPSRFFIESSRTEPSQKRVYESLLPFLPRMVGNTIFFVHCDDPDHLKTSLFSYCTKECAARKRSPEITSELFGTAFFSPLYTEPMLVYGGRITTELGASSNKMPSLWLNEKGILCASLPILIDPAETV